MEENLVTNTSFNIDTQILRDRRKRFELFILLKPVNLPLKYLVKHMDHMTFEKVIIILTVWRTRKYSVQCG